MVALCLAACSSATPGDRFEPYNRTMFAVNNTFYDYVLFPLSDVYVFITPHFFRKGVDNILETISLPLRMVNFALQAQPEKFADTTGRLMVNLVWGLGVFDAATRVGVPNHRTDFGKTMYGWGYENSDFFVIPLLGPSTIRDTIGTGVDVAINPVDNYLRFGPNNRMTSPAIAQGALGALSHGKSAKRLLREIKASSVDFYAGVRSMHMQKRRHDLRTNFGRPQVAEDFYFSMDMDDYYEEDDYEKE